MKVLIVDDSRMYLSMLDAYVQDIGHETLLASNGKDAIQIYHQEKPDLILLDVTMPDMDGYEVAKKIRACQRRVWLPIIFLSALIEDKDVLRGIEAGGDDYITKPASQVVIQAKVHAMQRIAKMSQKLIQTSGQLKKANQKLHTMSMVDGLTDISNRRCFDLILHKEWQRGIRNHQELTLMMIDIDHFKYYNDEYGHQQGDDCLIQVAQHLKNSCKRPSDVVARYGGEEFAVILPDCNPQNSRIMGDKLCQGIETLKIPHAKSPTAQHITISVGMATMLPQKNHQSDKLIQAADKALYQAKALGRNRVCLSDCND